MFDFSWGQLIFVSGLGLYLVGKKDLPKFTYTVGTQLGRVVGFLQGARAKADRFAQNSELNQLQNELRAGLRELDAVKSEMAMAMTPGGMMGKNLGALTANANRPMGALPARPVLPPPIHPVAPSLSQTAATMAVGKSYTPNPSFAAENQGTPAAVVAPLISSSLHQTTAAVAEQEWVKQGIHFQSAAERGAGLSPHHNIEKSGSAILSSFLQQSLIFDQYDRTVAEQDAVLQSKVSSIMMQAKQASTEKKIEEKKKD